MNDPRLFSARVDELRELLGDDVTHIIVESTANVAWLTGGARSYIERSETGVAAVVIDANGVTIHTTNNEQERLREEEFAGLKVRWVVSPWTDGFRPSLPRGPRVANDLRSASMSLADEIDRRQHTLSDVEIEKYREFGKDAAAALTDAIFRSSPDWTEQDLATAVASSLSAHGLTPVVTLVAGEERVTRHRHPLPTDSTLGGRALAAFCAERDGLILSATRLVCFGSPPDGLMNRYRDLLAVEAAFLNESRAGSTIAEAFTAGCDAYRANGFSADEYLNHHQGGRTGYRSRHYLATTLSTDRIEPDQALAWNPTGGGLKLEDTVLVTARGLDILTADPRWPVVDVDGRARPAIAVIR